MSHNPNKRRCLVKKLDFENGVVTESRSQTKGMRKMRARITRNINESEKTSREETELVSGSSPILMQKTRSSKLASKSSPVLKSQSNSTAIFRSRRKISFDETGGQGVKRNETTCSSRTSPVFKIKSSKSTGRSSTKVRPEEECNLESASGSSSQDIQSLNTDKSLENSIRIEETTQESDSNVQISSVESEDSQNSNLEIRSILESTMRFSPILPQNQVQLNSNKCEKRFDTGNDLQSSRKKIKK